MTPTEHEGTVAVDAAARVAWDRQRKAAESAGVTTAGDWENLNAMDQNYYREVVLPMVWAALEALPDRRADAWDEGYQDGLEYGTEYVDRPAGLRDATNPYRES